MSEALTYSCKQALQAVIGSDLVSNKVGNPGMRNRPRYIDLVTAFDIETTRLKDIEQSFMYIWQWQFGPDVTVVGRTWEEFTEFCLELKKWILFTFGKNCKLVVWVHNLSYEYSFLKGIYPFKQEEVFCMQRRKIAKCMMYDILELRCSYIHSNMSLDMFTKKTGCQIRKLTGTFDYDKIRYPWTELDPTELAYCVHDVRSLVEAITREMKMDGDTLSTIPMTSTGYVRRDAKNAIRSKPGWRMYLDDQLPDWDLYLALREAFRGGNTHANRFYSGKLVENVKSIDRSSSYPDVLVNCQFPIKHFDRLGEISLDRLHKNVLIHGKAALIRIKMDNVELKDPFTGCPYLAKDKCRFIVGGVFDNGRILSAAHLETTLTDVDYLIVCKQYNAEIRISDSWFSKYGYLPDEFRELINHYYQLKTQLKGDDLQKPFYEKIKAKINALYGMTAQNPVKENIIYADTDKVISYYLDHPEIIPPSDYGPDFIPDESMTPEEQLAKYNRKTFLVYQWGVWVTAHARRELQEMIDLAGDNFVYTDTDSVKYIGELDLTEYNERIMARSRDNGAYAQDAKGNTHFMGVYEVEHDYDKFVTLGAKKYAYEIDGTTYVTCAGVDKKLGGPELQRAGGVAAFKTGMVFREAGGTEAVYNDHMDMWIRREGRDLHITDNVVIRDSEYTLGVTEEYKMLLHKSELMKQLHREMDLEKYLTGTAPK